MTDLFDTTARRGLRSVALALALAGSLGLALGQEGAADVPQFIPRMSVDSRVQPQDTPREFLASRSMSSPQPSPPRRCAWNWVHGRTYAPPRLPWAAPCRSAHSA